MILHSILLYHITYYFMFIYPNNTHLYTFTNTTLYMFNPHKILGSFPDNCFPHSHTYLAKLRGIHSPPNLHFHDCHYSWGESDIEIVIHIYVYIYTYMIYGVYTYKYIRVYIYTYVLYMVKLLSRNIYYQIANVV